MPDRELLWTPSPERVERATITRFARWVAEHMDVTARSYEELWQWSVTDLEGFWESVVGFCGVEFDSPPRTVLEETRMPEAKWFPGATLNYAARLLRGRDAGAPAIQHASELRPLSLWDGGELIEQTAQIAAGLRSLGVGRGDRVAAYMPNIPETVAAFLASASLGAVWTSVAPEFGAQAVIDRLGQVRPSVLIAVDGYRYGGRDFDRQQSVGEITAALPPGTQVVRYGHLDGSGWPAGFADASAPARELSFQAVPFDYPLWILFSSGTTGLPKPIVHSHGGILLEQLKLSHLHLDSQRADRIFWFTTTGWMMWNLLIGVLLTDASIVLYDGHPGHPDLGALWDLAEEAGVTTFGTSAAFIASCMQAGLRLRSGSRALGGLRAVGSTGSPLSPEGFRWIYDQLGPGTWLFSTSGGTDLCTAFVGGVPTLPVRAGELQARALGASVEAWDEQGRELRGEVGELVITRPMPSMPVYLWGDENGRRLRGTYFSTYPGIWRHGDWIEITAEGAAVIHGRSDATINRGGVRMGTAEIYAIVLGLPEVLDALVVEVPRAGTEGSIELFIVLADELSLDEALEAALRRALRERCSPRHVPDRILQIPEVPRTLSGKVLEVPVKRILSGTPVGQATSRESLANPEALEQLLAVARAAGAGAPHA